MTSRLIVPSHAIGSQTTRNANHTLPAPNATTDDVNSTTRTTVDPVRRTVFLMGHRSRNDPRCARNDPVTLAVISIGIVVATCGSLGYDHRYTSATSGV